MKVKVKRKNLKTGALLICTCFVLVIGLLLLSHWEQQTDFIPSAAEEETTGSTVETVPAPQYKEGLQTILVIGLDKYQQTEESKGYLNNQQADFLMLLVLDSNHKTCDILQLNRDTMTKIQRLGIGGGAAGLFDGQLALAHTYGSGGSDSCINTVKSVSHFLHNIKIDHYITLTLDAIPEINDLVGGVTVRVLDDFTHLDPLMAKDQEVTLTGDQAQLYVQSRGSLEDSTNIHRMERQRQYLIALYQKFLKCMDEDEDFVSQSLLKVSSHIQTDCTASQLDAIGELFKECRLNPITTIDGQSVKGEEFMEFYADESSVQSAVDRLFYEIKD